MRSKALEREERWSTENMRSAAAHDPCKHIYNEKQQRNRGEGATWSADFFGLSALARLTARLGSERPRTSGAKAPTQTEA